MKQSWVVGIVMLYIIVFGLCMVLTAEVTTSDSFTELIMEMIWPSAHVAIGDTQTTGTIDAWDIMKIIWNIGGMTLLYFPVLFQGVYLWFWFCVCLPIALGFWVAVGTVLRGSSST